MKSGIEELGSSLVFNGAGQPCVAYHCFGTNALSYAYYNGSWQQETPDAGSRIGISASIAFDSAGTAHLSYYDVGASTLYYVCKSGELWTSRERVDASGDVGADSCIKALGVGIPAIAYVKHSYAPQGDGYNLTHEAKYAWKSGGAWQQTTIQTLAGAYCSLGIYNGRPAISYMTQNFRDQDLRFAEYTGSWSTSTVDPAGNQTGSSFWQTCGMYSSLAYDSAGTPYIAYMDRLVDEANHDFRTRLKCAYRTGGIWQIEYVDNSPRGSVGRFASIVVPQPGRPCVAYQQMAPAGVGTEAYLMCAFRESTGWRVECVDDSPATGFHASLALDTSGRPVIAYKDARNQALKLAMRTSSGWRVEVVDSSGKVGDYCSLAFKSNGEAYIAYMDWDNANLKVARSNLQYGRITGTVRDSAGAPIGGARVTASPGDYVATSEQNGTYLLDDIPPGTYTVVATKSGYHPHTRTGVGVSAGETTIADFTLSAYPPGTVAGRVRSTTGSEIAGALITAQPGNYTTSSGGDGNYSLSLAPGTYSISASKTGFQSQTKTGISVISGQVTMVDFALVATTTGKISGTVRNTAGNLVSGATVTCSPGGQSAVTDSNGDYTLPNIPAGSYTLTCTKSGYQSQTQQNILVPSGGSVLCNFHISPAQPQLVNGSFEATFTGGVCDGWQSFVTSGSVLFCLETTVIHDGSQAQAWKSGWSVHDAGVLQQVLACPGYIYEFSAWTWRDDPWNNGGDNESTWVGIDPTGGVSATSSSVVWSSPKISWHTWTQQSVSAQAQSNVITVFIRGRAQWAGSLMAAVVDQAVLSVRLPDVGTISGTVCDAAGSGIVGAQIWTASGGYTAVTGANGQYLIANVIPATYQICVSKEGYESECKTG